MIDIFDVQIDEILDAIDSCPQQYNVFFDWSTTTQALKAFNQFIKVSYNAKKMFAFTISSFAEEVMEFLLVEQRCKFIQTIDIRQAFSHLDEPIESLIIISYKPLSMKRLLSKYRALYKFTISQEAKAVFSCMLTSLMIDIAMSIHKQCNTRKTIQEKDVEQATDHIVYRRTYIQKHVASRSEHASRRIRKPNGRF